MSDEGESGAVPSGMVTTTLLNPRRRALGRGLGALMGEAQREELLVSANPAESAAPQGALASSGLASLAVAAIEPHPDQPRRHFDEAALDELAASIKARGVIQPVIVRQIASGRYQLVAGERRWRAAQKAQLHEIPALIRELSDRDVMALALIENIQREDLNPIEEARAYGKLAELEGMTQAEIAGLVDKSRSHVANLQRLLTLPESVIDHLATGRLDMGHGRALIGLANAVELAEQAVAKGMSVREVEWMARQWRENPVRSADTVRMAARETKRDADIAAVENHLQDFLGLPVRIVSEGDSRKGTVSVSFRNLDQLDLICQRLTGGTF